MILPLRSAAPGNSGLVSHVDAEKTGGSGVSRLPMTSMGADFPDDHHHLLDFDQRMYGTRNYYVDPAMRFGRIAEVDLPSPRLSLELPTISSWSDVDLPFIERNLKPEDAIVHLGPFRLDADRVTGAMVFTDNAARTEHDRDMSSAAIIAVENIRALWQLTETTHIALEGDLILLPFEDKIGLNGFGLRRDTLAFALGMETTPHPFGSASDLKAEVGTGFTLGGWDVTIRDSIGMRDLEVEGDFDAYLEEELTMLELGINPGLEGWRFEDMGEAGFSKIKSARNYAPGVGWYGREDDEGADVKRLETWERTKRNSRFEDDYDDKINFDFTNSLSVNITRRPEAQIRPFVRVFRTDSSYWYSDEEAEEEDEAERPEWYEGLTLGLITDRPSLRFPPYATYTMTRNSKRTDWTKVWRLGIRGPGRVTDYIFLSGNVGIATRSEKGEEREEDIVYAFHLAHQPRPMTMHSIDFVRYIEEPEDKLRTQATYRLSQGIGPYMVASLVGTRTESERDRSPNEEEWGVGGSLKYTRDRYSITWRSFYESEWEEDKGREPADYRHQLELNALLLPRVYVRYQYTWEDEGDEREAQINTELYRHKGIFRIAYRFRYEDSNDGETYFENLLVLTASRSLKGWSFSNLFGGDDKADDTK